MNAAARMLGDLMKLSPDDQIDALALLIRGWCGARGKPWSEGELPPPGAPHPGDSTS
jgi:hypothetical protein